MTSNSFPNDLVVFERGWLSSNSLLMRGPEPTLVDTGHFSHALQLEALLAHHLQEHHLHKIINTHLHSDHCGGNAHLQSVHAKVQVLIPPGQWNEVHDWSRMEEIHSEIGQVCPAFSAHEQIQPGQELIIHGRTWDVHAAPGHDKDAIMLFAPQERILISGDAFWETGFGVVFPELYKAGGFDEVRNTLRLIETLDPLWVVPGHGNVFTHVERCLQQAHQKLDYFESNPISHAKYACKVFIKFKLMMMERMSRQSLYAWALGCETLVSTKEHFFKDMDFQPWIDLLLQDLQRNNSISCDELMVLNH